MDFMRNGKTLSIVLVLLLACPSAFAAFGHDAAYIRNGTFGGGNYVFPSQLNVSGTFFTTNISSSANLTFRNATQGAIMTLLENGNVGIGYAAPTTKLGIVLNTGETTGGLIIHNEGTNYSFRVNDVTGDTSPFIIDDSGSVGIGTTSLSGRLTVNNPESASNYVGIQITQDETTSDIYALSINGAGSYGIAVGTNTNANCFDTSAAATCALNDYAEIMEFSERPRDGQIIVIDTENEGLLKVSARAYDPFVAGIASEDPAMVVGSYGLSIKGWNKSMTTAENNYPYPLAVAGRKIIQVSDENGKVAIGDLLVTSSQPGKAMRCDRREYVEKCAGAILGKAMTSARNGTVLALVSLQ